MMNFKCVIFYLIAFVLYCAIQHQIWLAYLKDLPDIWSGIILFTFMYGIISILSTAFYLIVIMLLTILLEKTT